MTKRTLDDMMGAQEDTQLEADLERDSAGPEANAPRTQYSSTAAFDPSELSIPRLNLAQGLSPEVRDRKAQPGDFLVMGFQPVQSVTLVVAGYSKQRRYVEQGQQRAKCWSPDGVQGYGDPGVACDTCPLAEWTPTGQKDPTTGRSKNAPPKCNEIDSWLCYSVTHGMPVTWNLKGTAMRASRALKGWAQGIGFGYFALEVTAESKSANGRAWQEPSPTLSTQFSTEECIHYANKALAAMGAPELPMGDPALDAEY